MDKSACEGKKGELMLVFYSLRRLGVFLLCTTTQMGSQSITGLPPTVCCRYTYNTQFKSPRVNILCVSYLHYNEAFTFKWCGNSWNKTFYSQRFWIGYNIEWGAVYMTPGQLSHRSEFTPVPSHGSTFVYMIPPQTSCRQGSTQAWFTPLVMPAWEFHSGMKSRNSIM